MRILFLLNPIHIVKFLPDTSLGFLLLLGLVCIVVVYRALAIERALRQIQRVNFIKEVENADRIKRMHQTCKDTRQLLSFVAYLFGLCIFWQTTTAFDSLSTSSHFVIMSLVNTLLVASIFAADVFLVLLLLHSLQWYAAAKLDRKMLEVL